MKQKISDCFSDLCQAIGEDCQREGLIRTPERITNAMKELLNGYEKEPTLKELLSVSFDAGNYDDWICMKEIPFGSLCEHHVVPFIGTVSIAYWPKNHRVIGLSKLPKVVDILSHQLQLQERFTTNLAEAIFHYADAKAVVVVVEAEHFCISLRGASKRGIKTVTRHHCGSADHFPF